LVQQAGRDHGKGHEQRGQRVVAGRRHRFFWSLDGCARKLTLALACVVWDEP
jgi:hypothetical protein